MWIANRTRPDITIAVRVVARFSYDPKAARHIIEYLNAKAHWGLTFRRGSQLDDLQLEYDLRDILRTWTRTTPTRWTTGVRSPMWLMSVAVVHLCRGFLGHRSASPHPLQRQSTWLWQTG